ncbi:MAG: enoyl-CoA hydratase [Sulfobacillus acidophilus]|uniref:Enoyl-CoA hydratase n=1 Tax=Sulfobacillus acidophilus TaxID=53633 RepID=A0A2T2WNY4_9FIRM|nr:MAG: enoyl-CoA hydratase [Sulfobacillus acidophilus]
MEPVSYVVTDGIAVITLNQPERRNALSAAIRTGLRERFEQFNADGAARVAIVTGAGTKAFCAGADLKEMAEESIGLPGRDFMPILNRNIWVDKPVLAAVNGAALGGGFLLAMMCDLVVTVEHAMFGMPETKWSRGAPWSVPLSWMIPQRIWMEMALTGESIDAHRAYAIGLVNRISTPEHLMADTIQLAAKIRDNAPLTVNATRRMIYMTTEMGRTAAWDVADALFERVYSSEDAIEGPRAFREQRLPQWKGR